MAFPPLLFFFWFGRRVINANTTRRQRQRIYAPLKRRTYQLLSALQQGVATTDYSYLTLAFRTQPTVRPYVQTDHPHPNAAAQRTAADTFHMRVVARSGLSRYSLSASRKHQRAGLEGQRYFYDQKDFATTFQDDPVRKGHVVDIIDADYYVDMHSYLAKGLPLMLYTLVPDRAAFTCDEYWYRFLTDGTLYYNSTGDRYIHDLWDYSSNATGAFTWWGPFLTGYQPYEVDRRTWTTDRCSLLLTPTRWVPLHLLVLGWMAGRSHAVLEHKNHVKDGFAVVHSHRPKQKQTMWTSVAKVEDLATDRPMWNDSYLPAADVEYVRARFELGKQATMTYINQVASDYDVDPTPLHRYFMAGCPSAQHFVSTTHWIHGYEYPSQGPNNGKGPNIADDTRQRMFAYAPPILDAAFTPLFSKSNEWWAVGERKDKVKPPLLYHWKLFDDSVDEFSKFVVPDQRAHTLHPAPHERVEEQQTRPMQRMQILAALWGWSTAALWVTVAFLKNEVYGGVKPPRIITQSPALVKIKYSMVIYAMSDLVKETCGWYAFGKTPRETSEQVARVAQRAKSFAVETDFTRFDGTVSNLVRYMERVVIARAFTAEDLPFVHDCLDHQTHNRVHMSDDTCYDTGFARMSGSPETSLANSLANAFCAYLTFRTSTDMSPQQCWDALGIYGGDDGFTCDIDLECYARTASSLGHILTGEKVHRYSPVGFLSRTYSPSTWDGIAVSIPDVARQLKSRNAYQGGNEVHPGIHAANRFAALAREPYTPVLGPLATAVMADCAAAGHTEDRHAGDISYYHKMVLEGKLDASDMWPYATSREDWMLDHVAMRLGVEHKQIKEFEAEDLGLAWLLNKERAPSFPTPEQKPVPGTVVDGELVPGGAKGPSAPVADKKNTGKKAAKRGQEIPVPEPEAPAPQGAASPAASAAQATPTEAPPATADEDDGLNAAQRRAAKRKAGRKQKPASPKK